MNRKRRARIALEVIIALAVFAIAAIVVIILGRQRIKMDEDTIAQLNASIAMNQRRVYVASVDITAGEQLTMENLSLTTISSGIDASLYMTESELGYKARIDIPFGTAIELKDITEAQITKDARALEITAVTLASNQQNHDIVDVWIMFPDGEGFIVLAKKEIFNLNMDTSVMDFYMTEEEHHIYNSACVDAYIRGGKLYTAKYIEPTIQDEAVPFYPVSAEIQALINSGDPNIVTRATRSLNSAARADLERRLEAISEDVLSAMGSAMGTKGSLTSDSISFSGEGGSPYYTYEETGEQDTETTSSTSTDSDIETAQDTDSDVLEGEIETTGGTY